MKNIIKTIIFVFLIFICNKAFALTPYEINKKYFATPEEALTSIQSILSDIKIQIMVKADWGGYDSKYVPIEKFAIADKNLVFFYPGGSKTLVLDKMYLSSIISPPQEDKPCWSFGLNRNGQPFEVEIFCASTQDNIELLNNAIRSLMAASNNPNLKDDKDIPSTLKFKKQASQRIDRPKLGFKVIPLSEEEKEAFHLDCGLKVVEVEKESPSEKAGVRPGDILLEANDEKLKTTEDLRDALQLYENNFTLLRDKKSLKIKITIPASF